MGREIFNELGRNQTDRNNQYTRKAKKRLKVERNHQEMVKVGVFGGILAIGCLVGCLAFARPSQSALEKRNLTEKPAFSISALLDGSYLDQYQTWYSDTYPGREKLLKLYAGIKSLYGFRTESVHGDIGQADEIPTIPSSSGSDSNQTEPDVTISPSSDGTDTTETLPAETEPVETADTSATETVPAETTPGDTTPVTQPSVSGETQPENQATDFEQNYGAVYVKGSRGIGLFYFNLNAANTYIDTMNRAADRLSSTGSVYCLLAPTAIEFYMDDALKASLGASSETDTFSYIYGSLNANVKQVSVIDALKAHTDEYIYFNTDHHWTALGAYYAYQQFCSVKGITASDLAGFEKKEFPGFLGSFYTNSMAESLLNNPDTVYAYVPHGTNTLQATQRDGTILNWYVVNDVSSYNAYNKYSTFIAGDNPYTIINNPAITDGSSCLIIKESYGNAFTPFLVDHYQTVHIIDYRYYSGDIAEFAKENNITDVIFLNNADAISDSNSMEQLSSLIQ